MSEIGQQIIQAVRDVAARDPLHVFEGECVYVCDGAPACLIGCALWDLDLIDETIAEKEYNEESIDYFLNHLDIELDDDEVAWLESAQHEQDRMSTWQTAVRTADDR